MREFTRNNQPHFQSHDTSYSVTLLLFDAVTGPELEALREALATEIERIEQDDRGQKDLRKAIAREENFEALERLLHDQRRQSHLLRAPAAAEAVGAYFRKFDGDLLRLHAYSVMSNHAHALFDLSPQLQDADPPELRDADSLELLWPLDRLIGRLKGGSAHAANAVLGRGGKLWMKGYHDRYVRSEKHFAWVYAYILNNPVKAGLVDRWIDHPGTWAAEELR